MTRHATAPPPPQEMGITGGRGPDIGGDPAASEQSWNRHFLATALTGHGRPTEVTADLAAPLLRVVDELIPEVAHDAEQYSNDRIEWDRG
ncbi:MAG: hypothetical protein GY929_01795 [Actinomycetia bacterium]|nr:hypothetical protein [Actinomycetes bacterium]